MRTRAQPRSCLVRLAFIESSVFTRRISAFGLDESLRRGKRGGYRVHYLHLVQHAIIAFVFIYSKSDRDSLSASQKRALKATAETIIAEWRSA